MFWVDPPIARQDGRPIGALSSQLIEGTTWQRWSRHRTAANPWRPGIDCIETQTAFVDLELTKELSK